MERPDHPAPGTPPPPVDGLQKRRLEALEARFAGHQDDILLQIRDLLKARILRR